MSYNTCIDDDLASTLKLAAQSNLRSVRKQMHLYITQGLQRDGYLPTQNKTGLSSLVGNKPATDTQQATEE